MREALIYSSRKNINKWTFIDDENGFDCIKKYKAHLCGLKNNKKILQKQIKFTKTIIICILVQCTNEC